MTAMPSNNESAEIHCEMHCIKLQQIAAAGVQTGFSFNALSI
jgi:hypothetical protein